MIIAVTGHRPEKIVHDLVAIQEAFRNTFLEADPERILVGMASGIDLIAGIEGIKTCYPVWAIVPWKGHKPRKADEGDYQFVTHFAQKVIYVNEAEDYPGPWVYQKRNEWMVDNATNLLSYWDGSAGGTGNCVKYAKGKIKHRNLYEKISR